MEQSGSPCFGEDPFGKNAQGIAFIMHDFLLLVNILQTKPQF